MTYDYYDLHCMYFFKNVAFFAIHQIVFELKPTKASVVVIA